MKALPTLLKIAHRNLETLRRHLAEQVQRLALIDERLRAHEQQIVSEQKHAMKDYESQRSYGGFAVLAIQRRRALQTEREMVEQVIGHIRTLVTEAHVEAGKFERLIELESAREKAKREKRENADLDEFATLRAGRATGNKL